MTNIYEYCGQKYCNKCDTNTCFSKNKNGKEFCTGCVSIPCWRCGDTDSHVEHNYHGENYDILTFQWLCFNCDTAYWCQQCDKIEGEYFLSDTQWYCFPCLVKEKFKENKCECGSDIRFYDKKTNKWHCSVCIS